MHQQSRCQFMDQGKEELESLLGNGLGIGYSCRVTSFVDTSIISLVDSLDESSDIQISVVSLVFVVHQAAGVNTVEIKIDSPK